MTINLHDPVDESTAKPAQRMLLTVNEVAAELGCGRDTVYALIASQQLTSVLLGERLRRVRRRDLEEYIAELDPNPPLAPPRAG